MDNKIGQFTVIENGVLLGDEGIFIGNNVTIRSGCIIGNNVVIGHNVVIEEDCIIEDDSRIQSLAYITKGTKIGRKVFIGPMVCTTNDKRILSHGRGEFIPDASTIKDYARIGANSTIFPGVVIGENALIGAGSRVIKDVKDREVWHEKIFSFHSVVPDSEVING